jgi:hypothetical protein
LPVFIRLPEVNTLFVPLVQTVQLREELHIDWRNHADIRYQTGNRTRRVSSPRKPKAEDLITWLVVLYNEVVGFNDVLRQASSRAALSASLRGTKIPGSYPGVIVHNLVKFLRGIVLVGANTRDEAAESGDI